MRMVAVWLGAITILAAAAAEGQPAKGKTTVATSTTVTEAAPTDKASPEKPRLPGDRRPKAQ